MRCGSKENLSLIILFGVAWIISMLTTRPDTLRVRTLPPALKVSHSDPTTVSSFVSKEKSTVVPNIFNSSYLLDQIVKELETDGWVKPRGVGGVAKRIYKLKVAMRQDNKLSRNIKKKTKEAVLYEAERWKVNYMGCFRFDPPLSLLIPSTLEIQISSVTDCVLRCDKKRFTYAAISSGKMCTCGKSMSTQQYMYERSLPTDFCKMRCKSRKDIRPCGGNRSASVYKTRIHRKESVTLSDVHQMEEGCFIKPKNFEKVFTKKSILSNGTAAHCLVHCERSWEPIAAWDPQLGECMCGKYDERLSVRELLKSSEIGFCDKKYCNTTKRCQVRYLASMRTYAHDQRCDSRTFLPARNGTPCALSSFPGSGNTWLRHLIESATGIYSGSIYNDLALYERGFLGEILPWDSMKTSVVKTHEGNREGASQFDEAIMVVRNPYDAFVAEYNRVADGHTGHADPRLFKIKEWSFFVMLKLTKWLNVITYFSEVKRVHVTFFEDVVTNPIDEVRKICQFLKIPIPNLTERLQCLISSTGGDFKRPKRKLDFDPFTSLMKKNINLFVKKGREILQKKGLPRLPDYERHVI